MIKKAIIKVSKGKDLTAEEMVSVFGGIMSGKVSEDDMEGFLTALAAKGETIDEIMAAAVVMRDKMVMLKLPYPILLDTCGTGGGASSFNVSTVVAVIASGAGAKVAKHGNRSYSSHCGSADILENLGVKIDISPRKAAECIKETGINFLFAPLYHGAMKHVIEVRRRIKRRTIFNILGPLSNPALANAQLVGVFEERFTDILAGALMGLGSKRAFVVHGSGGFDEVSISGKTRVSELKDGRVETYDLSPEDFGIKRAYKEDVACTSMDESVKAFRSILDGERSPRRDMVLINASLALIASGIVDSLREGVDVASSVIDSGRAGEVLRTLAAFTNG